MSEAVNCQSTMCACALLSLDAICCIPCCMCFGGCCGKCGPFSAKAFGGNEFSDIKPGKETNEAFQTVCFVQCVAAILMPFTCCGCCWACCGTCAPCAMCVIQKVNGNNDAKIIPIDSTEIKPPMDQFIDRAILDFAK
jgi:hypothetical protein